MSAWEGLTFSCVQLIAVFTYTIRPARMSSTWGYSGKQRSKYFELNVIGELIIRLFIYNMK